ncbi:aminotransferase class III-fold pyridoxal phosphate-dependent enzyme [Streptomyces sp. NPDC005931]|uniref:aminotransferase class III-fold pyridoxal phosphate-dependent enzyme n=1 Tax=Streptomyces sp. NPDC005931 TaxID=3364737 RepID=UPI0036CCBBCB
MAGPLADAPRRPSTGESAARTYARALPVVPVRARGLTIEGADGRRYLDCLSGAGTLALGHNHPLVLEAIRKVLDSGAPLNAADLATPVRDAFLDELLRTLPPGLAGHARVRFCGPAATDAVKVALRLARAATGRSEVIALTGAHHGTTTALRQAPHRPYISCDACGVPRDAHAAGLLQYARDHRCPSGTGAERGPELAAHRAESVLHGPRPGTPVPAGVIVEPVQGAGGVIPAPDTWLRRIRRLTADRSVPLIVDETQTGIGWTGAFWAVEHSGVTPDVMVLSEAVGGSLPLAVVVHHEDLDVWTPDAPTDTFPGNQLALAAGTATLAHVRENGLAGHAATLGTRMRNRLLDLAGEFACVGEVRGRGLMVGLELVDPEKERNQDGDPGRVPIRGTDGTGPGTGPGAGPEGGPGSGLGRGGPEPVVARCEALGPRRAAPELAAAVQRECLRRGLIVGLCGPDASVVRLHPPLTITEEQVTAVLDRLADAVEAVALDRSGEEDGAGGPGRPFHDGVPHRGAAARGPQRQSAEPQRPTHQEDPLDDPRVPVG